MKLVTIFLALAFFASFSTKGISIETLNPQEFNCSDHDIIGAYRIIIGKPISEKLLFQIKELCTKHSWKLKNLQEHLFAFFKPAHHFAVLGLNTLVGKIVQPKLEKLQKEYVNTCKLACDNDIRAGYRVLTGQLISPEQFIYLKRSCSCYKWDLRNLAIHLLALEETQENLNIPSLFSTEIFPFKIHNGMTLFGYKSDLFIAHNIARSKRWEPQLEQLMRKCVKKGDTVLDIGANIGYFTAISSELVGPHGRVISIEALPCIADLIHQAKEKNNWTSVQVYTTALGNSVGELKFLVNSVNPGHSRLISDNEIEKLYQQYPRSLVTVPITKLDILLAPQNIDTIHFIKIDVEGAEDIVLQGAKTLLQKFHPMIALEFSPSLYRSKNVDPLEILNFLKDLGYKIGIINTVAKSNDPIKEILTNPLNPQNLLDYIDKKGFIHLDLLFV